MMAELPASGPNAAKARFFSEVASAFEFLALFHSLPEKEQRELMEVVRSAYASIYNEKAAAKHKKGKAINEQAT